MLTLTCSIRLRDGKKLTAKASANSPYDEPVIEYSGDLTLFPDRPVDCGVMVMRYLMQCHADTVKGEFTETIEGKFDAAE